MTDFDEFTRRFQVEPTVYRPIEQRNFWQRTGDMLNQLRQWAVTCFVIFLLFMALAMVLASFERMVYRKNLIDKDYIIEVNNGQERAKKYGSR
jgi:hypothetical protein